MVTLQVWSRALAKINLSLSVLGRRADGLHEISSLVAFARHGDTMGFAPGSGLTLATTGPCAAQLGGDDENLVLKAARNFVALFPAARLGDFSLVKRLPVAAGIGGGSADAACALRLLAGANQIRLDDPKLLEAAAATGADVPVCLASRARMMGGIGTLLGPQLGLPPMFIVMVNPGVATPTRAVFAAMRLERGQPHDASRVPRLGAQMAARDVIAALAHSGNDMEEAAISVAPVITSVLEALCAGRGCQLARMSGSGATCFGLFSTGLAATRAARAIKSGHPAWWVKASILG